jgi:sodium transport system ATP-binding protein
MRLQAHEAHSGPSRSQQPAPSGTLPQVIEVEGLCKEYEEPGGGVVRAVEGVSLHAHVGEVYGLLGPNGAGKTTTLRCLATILTPTAGTARIAGFDVVRQPEMVRRNLGFLSGSTGLYARLTPRETLTFFGKLNGLSGETLAARVEKTLALFDVTSYADRANDRLSTGMKQRVSLARAVVHDPPVVILDEPTSGLDPVASQNVEDAIVELRTAGKCVLLSTHMMYQAEELCDRLGVIGHGRMLAEGTAAEIIARTGEANLRGAFFKLVGRSTRDGGKTSEPALTPDPSPLTPPH